MKELFQAKRFDAISASIITQTNAILADYAADDYDLTVRQLYYQFVSHDLFPADRTWTWTGSKWIRDPNGTPNADPNYKWLGGIISDARLAGMIDWEMIKDRGRSVVHPAHWNNPAEIVDACAKQFRVDRWENQPCYVEVMVEKQALEGILEPVCRKLDIPFTSNKGYSSSSAMYEASKRFLRAADEGKELYVMYLGDHDPSGIDMSRDVLDRLELFTEQAGVSVQRLALNMDQIEELKPPENPAKITDSRADSYIRRFGRSSWELDAIEPRQLAALVENSVDGLIDENAWQESGERQTAMRAELQAFADNYGK